jgi:hypothetical protein
MDGKVRTMRIPLYIRKSRADESMNAVAADSVSKRDTPWDPNNPDLRGFNFESPTEEALLEKLPGALERFLSSLGFVVHSPVFINRDHYADILNLWPAIYVADAMVSDPTVSKA